MSAESCTIDGLTVPVRHPATLDEVGDLVLHVRHAAEAIYPLGGGTMLDLGLPPRRPGLAVDLRRLASVVDYPARDMTVTVQAGMAVSELQKMLAAEQQRLPIDVPCPDRATVGGILATNLSGPRRYGWGTLRDYVIGFTAINDEGRQIKAGGRVVKNVAGYDLCKLFIGSLGTLGIITQVTFKVVPVCEQSALVSLACRLADLEELLTRLYQSRTRPVALEVLNPAAARWFARQVSVERSAVQWLVLVGYESNVDAVNWQVQELIKEVRTNFPLEAWIGAASLPLWQGLAELPGAAVSQLCFKASLPSSRCAEFCRWLAATAPEAMLQLHAGNGVAVLHLPLDASLPEAAQTVAQCRDWLGPGGSLVVLHCPTAWKQTISVWGPPRGDVRVMRAIKQKLDPHRIFNPGRFVEGL